MVPCSPLPEASRSAGVSRPWSAELRTMCVNGSLIRSSTCRSSSVSAPCISSSICLPSSPERSRTMRGSFCQALPIGCMRVFMTPSCSSAVTLDKPLQRHLELGVLVAAGDFQQLVAGQDQLGDHRHQMFERVDVDADRLVGDLVGFLDVGLAGDSRLPGGLCLGFGFDFLGRRRCSGGFRRGGRRGRLGGGRRCGLLDDGGRRGFRRSFGLGFAEGALEIVERDFAGTQRTLQHLIDQCTLGNFRGGHGLHRGCGDDGNGRGHRLGLGMLGAFGHLMQFLDQVFVGAFRLGLGGFEAGQDFLDAVDARQDQRHGFGLDRHAVAEFAHQRLAGMRQRFQPRQPQEAAGALDGVDQAEDVIQNLRVARVLLEPHQLIVDRIQALAGLGQKFPQQVIHETGLRTQWHATSTRLTERSQLLCKAFNIGCANGKERDQQRDKTAEMVFAACFQPIVNHKRASARSGLACWRAAMQR